MTPEGLYGRRKMTAHLRRSSAPGPSAGSVDRAMRILGLTGIRRGKGTRTTIQTKDAIRAGDLPGAGIGPAALHLSRGSRILKQFPWGADDQVSRVM